MTSADFGIEYATMADSVKWFLDRLFETAFASFLSWNTFIEAIGRIPNAFLSFSSGLAWPYILSNLALAWVVYMLACKDKTTAAGSFREFAFPARIYRHASTLLDARFMAIDLIPSFLLYLPLYGGLGVVGTKLMSVLLVDRLAWEPPHVLSRTEIFLASLAFVALIDLVNYWGHVWCHKIPFLWSFHEVHHSAEVLTPATAYRIHPVENVFMVVLHAPVIGLSAVFFQNMLGSERQFMMIGGATIIGFTLHALGAYWKHSHIWFTFGPWLNRLLISPAHHQIHHSVDPRHWNKNFGATLSMWDRLFGTLYEPREPEAFHVGLPNSESGRFKTIQDLYVRPFGTAMRTLRWMRRGIPSISRVPQE